MGKKRYKIQRSKHEILDTILRMNVIPLKNVPETMQEEIIEKTKEVFEEMKEEYQNFYKHQEEKRIWKDPKIVAFLEKHC